MPFNMSEPPAMPDGETPPEKPDDLPEIPAGEQPPAKPEESDSGMFQQFGGQNPGGFGGMSRPGGSFSGMSSMGGFNAMNFAMNIR